MDLHKPKPWHGWREFLKELGTIAMGVCIALAAEQGVEWLHWREQVAEARTAIANEMALNVWVATIRQRSNDCVENRLDQLAAILDAAAKNGNLPPVGDIGIPPRMYWGSSAWNSVVASQVTAHFPRPELAQLAMTYMQISQQADISLQENAAWNTMYTMVGPGRHLDQASEAQLRGALSQARSMNRNIAGPSATIIDGVKSLGLPFSRQNLALIAQGETISLSDSAFTSVVGAVCTPIGPVPTTYGQGMYSPNRGHGSPHFFSTSKGWVNPFTGEQLGRYY